MEIMKTKHESNAHEGSERFNQMKERDWERYQSLYQNKKDIKEKKKDKQEKRDILYTKFEENLIKLEKEKK